jgi:mRNA interferase YafQ
MKYLIYETKQYKKSFKKIKKQDKKFKQELSIVINILASNKKLAQKYRDHPLTGELKIFRELHVRPDLLLMYRKEEDSLILYLVNLRSHSELF